MPQAFKFTGFEDLDAVGRSFILICVSLAYPAWDAGFEIGAFGSLFFEKVFFAWSIASALLLTLVVNPAIRQAVPRIAWVATGFPSVWLILALFVRAYPQDLVLKYGLFFSGLVIYLVCMPYTVYMLVSILYPDLLNAGKRLPRLTVLFFILFAIAGYITGSNHQLMLTCEDFQISGQYVPEDCRPARGH